MMTPTRNSFRTAILTSHTHSIVLFYLLLFRQSNSKHLVGHRLSIICVRACKNSGPTQRPFLIAESDTRHPENDGMFV